MGGGGGRGRGAEVCASLRRFRVAGGIRTNGGSLGRGGARPDACERPWCFRVAGGIRTNALGRLAGAAIRGRASGRDRARACEPPCLRRRAGNAVARFGQMVLVRRNIVGGADRDGKAAARGVLQRAALRGRCRTGQVQADRGVVPARIGATGDRPRWRAAGRFGTAGNDVAHDAALRKKPWTVSGIYACMQWLAPMPGRKAAARRLAQVAQVVEEGDLSTRVAARLVDAEDERRVSDGG
jgi:hypothetical protein